jgi:hypothetical protein
MKIGFTHGLHGVATLIWSAMVLVATLLMACGDGGDSACVTSLCEPGETRCAINYVAQCNADGTAWDYSPCGTVQYCTDTGAGAACASRTCTNLGGGYCLDSATLELCPENGAEKSTVACASNQICPISGSGNAGVCVDAECEAGASMCGHRSTLLCEGGVWIATNCGGEEICDIVDGAATCIPRTCVPQTAWCDGNVASLCDAEGRKVSSSTCGGGQVCKDGFCQAAVCGIDDIPGANDPVDTPSDAGAGGGVDGAGAEAGPTEPEVVIPPLQKTPKVTFNIGGVPQTFDLNARAIYVNADKLLKIEGGKGVRKLEINIAGVDITTVGGWKESDLTEISVAVCYYDGSNKPFVGGACGGDAGGFTFIATAYDVIIDKNNGPDSYVEGTFSSTMESANGEVLEFTDGVIDVLFK